MSQRIPGIASRPIQPGFYIVPARDVPQSLLRQERNSVPVHPIAAQSTQPPSDFDVHSPSSLPSNSASTIRLHDESRPHNPDLFMTLCGVIPSMTPGLRHLLNHYGVREPPVRLAPSITQPECSPIDSDIYSPMTPDRSLDTYSPTSPEYSPTTPDRGIGPPMWMAQHPPWSHAAAAGLPRRRLQFPDEQQETSSVRRRRWRRTRARNMCDPWTRELRRISARRRQGTSTRRLGTSIFSGRNRRSLGHFANCPCRYHANRL